LEISGPDLMDRLESALPRVPPAETARRILEVMRRVCRAGTATVFRERAGMLRWIAGERVPETAIRTIRTALRHGRGPVHGLAFAEPPGEPGGGRSLVVWAGRPRDAERDVVYMQGPDLRPGAECAEHLAQLIVLLGQLG
jgi:hypothetical protein